MEIQGEYNLKKVEEQGIHIQTEDFDPSKSRVTLTFSGNMLDEKEWGPTMNFDINWEGDRKVFSKVSDVTVKIQY